MSVFVIINEWTDDAMNTSSQVAGSLYFESENSAHESLKLIAEAYDVELGADETSIQIEGNTSLVQYEEFYIQELTAG